MSLIGGVCKSGETECISFLGACMHASEGVYFSGGRWGESRVLYRELFLSSGL